MDKNVPCKIFYQTTFYAENAINGANMRRCHTELSNKQNIANNGIISEHDASIIRQR